MSTPLLEARGIARRFGHVTALRGAGFVVNHGEIVALIGDNGAGKSTLTKILSGADTPTSGDILVEGRKVDLSSPHATHELGIETVYQDLAPDLDPAATLFLGREILRSGLLGRLGFLDKKARGGGALGHVLQTQGVLDLIRPFTLTKDTATLRRERRRSTGPAADPCRPARADCAYAGRRGLHETTREHQ
jgi:ABC-type sugar transport system ATPase subunit